MECKEVWSARAISPWDHHTGSGTKCTQSSFKWRFLFRVQIRSIPMCTASNHFPCDRVISPKPRGCEWESGKKKLFIASHNFTKRSVIGAVLRVSWKFSRHMMTTAQFELASFTPECDTAQLHFHPSANEPARQQHASRNGQSFKNRKNVEARSSVGTALGCCLFFVFFTLEGSKFSFEKQQQQKKKQRVHHVGFGRTQTFAGS